MVNCNTYWYAYGYKSKSAAIEAINNGYADGEICSGEKPFVKKYTTDRGDVRYGIKCVADFG